jgi:cell division protein ZapB
MDTEIFDLLENRLESLIAEYNSLKLETSRLRDENQRLVKEREGFKGRIDAILKKLEGI